MTPQQYINRLNNLDPLTAAQEALLQTKEQFLFLQKEQLYEGKNREGKSNRPFYQDDPYFKTPESAQRYSDWKDSITPNPNREKGAPNFFITGYWYDSLDVVVRGLSIDFPNAIPDIEKKWGEKVLGLDPERRAIYLSTYLLPAFFSIIKKQLAA